MQTLKSPSGQTYAHKYTAMSCGFRWVGLMGNALPNGQFSACGVCDDPGWPKPSPSPRAVLIFSAVRAWTCSLLPPQASSTMTDRKAVIKNADMSEDMQQDAVDCATQAMEKYNIEKDIAAYIKKVRQEGVHGWIQAELSPTEHDQQIETLTHSHIYFCPAWRWDTWSKT